jgi:1-deoxy-D-xylulose-5-phosphate synthase
MLRLAKTNERIVAVTAAMPEGTGLIEFSRRYPKRFFDVGIAEQHAVTFSAGLASRGLKPVVAIYSTFLQRGFDQILHDVCIDAHPVVFAIDRGGIVGEDGPTHHGLFDYSYLRCMPNMTIMAPKDENELARMMVTAVHHDGPVAVRYPRGSGEGVEMETNPRPLKIGKAEVLCQGNDVLIIAIGKSVAEAVKAGRLLLEKGIEVTIINARFVKPLDAELILEYAGKIKTIITVEEHVLDGGFGSAVLEMLGDNGMTGFCLKRIGIHNKFVEHGPQDILRQDYGIDCSAIVAAAEGMNGNPV